MRVVRESDRCAGPARHPHRAIWAVRSPCRVGPARECPVRVARVAVASIDWSASVSGGRADVAPRGRDLSTIFMVGVGDDAVTLRDQLLIGTVMRSPLLEPTDCRT